MASTATSKNTKSRFDAGVFPAQSDDVAIAPLLSRAQLLKTRGQWEEAVAVCTDAVRRFPASSSPYSLLGDIYLAQNKTDDALHWYHMALERNPTLPAVVERHDALLNAKRATATGNFSAAKMAAERTARLPVSSQTLAPAPHPPTERVSVEHTIEWLDRVFPPGRSVGMARLFTAVGVVVALLVGITGVCLFIAFSTNTAASDISQPLLRSATRPSRSTDTPIAAPMQGSIAVPNVNSASGANAEPTPAPALMDRLNNVHSDAYTVTSAQANLQNRQVQLEIALSSVPGEEPTSTRNRILQAAAQVSESVFRLEPTVQRFLVRAILSSRPAGISADANGGSLVFVGETSSVALHTLRTTSPVPDSGLLNASFTNVWWANALRITAQ